MGKMNTEALSVKLGQDRLQIQFPKNYLNQMIGIS